MPMQLELIAKLKSMTAQRDLRAPKPSGACYPKAHALKQQTRESNCERQARRRADAKSFKLKYFEFFSNVSANDVATQLYANDTFRQPVLAGTGKTVRPRPSLLLEAVLQYNKARKKVIDVFFLAVHVDFTTLSDAVECLLHIVKDDS